MTTSSQNKAMASQAMTPTVGAQSRVPNARQISNQLFKPELREKFEAVLGDKTAAFLQTVSNVVLDPANYKLGECDPNSVLRSCMACAVTGLTIDPALGQAAIVPFGKTATFMPMRNGLVQLANNTGIIQRIQAAPVYEGDIASYNPFTGDYVYNQKDHERNVLTGYMAYIRFTNGADHYLYMTVEELHAHGKRYSQTYKHGYGLWKDNFPAMAEKTVLKQILKKWASLDTSANTKLMMALKFDSATPTSLDIEAAQAIYPDAVDVEADMLDDVEAEIVREIKEVENQ